MNIIGMALISTTIIRHKVQRMIETIITRRHSSIFPLDDVDNRPPHHKLHHNDHKPRALPQHQRSLPWQFPKLLSRMRANIAFLQDTH